MQFSEPTWSLSWRVSLVRIPPFLLYWQLEFCCLGIVFPVYMLSFISSVSVHLLSYVNCLHVALKSETNEGEHRWAYYLDRILAKKVCNVFLNHYSSCFCFSLSWHIRKMPPCRSALLVACSLHYHTEGADGRFLQVEKLSCTHLRGDGVTGGSNFLVVCSLTSGSSDLFSFSALKYITLYLCFKMNVKFHWWNSATFELLLQISTPGHSVNVPC